MGYKLLAIILGKVIIYLTKILKIGGGSAAPGYYALKFYPNLVAELTKDIPKTVVITGTNGKTTTSRMLYYFAREQGLKVIRNSTGSNLERGIASTLISNSHMSSGKLKNVDLAIWELDEAAFNQLVPEKIKPDIIIFLNVFRDQLDRYGEIDSILRGWKKTLEKIGKDTTVLINGDDQNLLGLKNSIKCKVETFGIEDYKIKGEGTVKKIGEEKLDLEAKNVNLLGLSGTNFDIQDRHETWSFSIPLPGIYHVYDFLAAYITSQKLGIGRQAVISALDHYSPAFGRAEKLDFGYILLIKNPTGATQVLETLKGELKVGDRLLFALNDNIADGTDVSWIWDSEFEMLSAVSSQLSAICSGTRAEDMALRLKYAGLEPEQIIIQRDLKKALKQAREGLGGRLFILPTYTALLRLQKILAREGTKEHYWKE
ncbi:hypothetical protein A3A14_02720 [Candidatus Daviesbacteria bacterium RIFCSPLOWO2_01_FULL_43_38]|uniref:Lipid II isoglutaminyl synthase (glutamine-hydrolyzing) subunit MurT n=3 Tax=Candidatus Daviesiibacteriota TaxID=1752718 RepID=A0A1F5K428_9BACT|nr:MAG: Mur ligase family protein [Candidatus Daviesbacteria bacterium GW2011_GWA1_42_6]KKS71063.1 MAG: Mur ligase family protein [Candidatus Daviesbacteria bacterium GW2011_GWA2_42_7]OGE19983.1 MAG: hypothetical protein A2874_00640 [Candidatus Daviesbacteria bacterium RIFCSPHIGHO2_01_FULL_43_17]OGE35733.1 MAG: hypothetical protein A3E45_00325 [Candidatus Daviesbacteria bacterium RIFCSPHIGHO2_12_FULL_43_11]OGE63421.1 MAG: hypothetical protein A3A14_02720 [Candidatus Daviesbacteria bacterium RIF